MEEHAVRINKYLADAGICSRREADRMIEGGRVRIAAQGRTLTVSASSLGGGRIRVNAIDGMEASFSGAYPTLIIRNEDRPGIVAEVSQVLSRCNANIAAMQLYRDRRGGLAVMVIECDAPLPSEARRRLAALDGVVRCTYLDMEGA